jgi:hypothetical protein
MSNDLFHPVSAENLQDLHSKMRELVGRTVRTSRPLTDHEKTIPSLQDQDSWGGEGELVAVGDLGDVSFEICVDWGMAWQVDIVTSVEVADAGYDRPPLGDAQSRNRAALVVIDAYITAINAAKANAVTREAVRGTLAAVRAALEGETRPAKLGIHPETTWGIALAVIENERPG